MRYFEEIYIGQTKEFGSYKISEKEIIEFASKYDPQVFHTDPIKAKQTQLGGIIASGWHTCAIFMRMFVDHYLLGGNGMPSPGIDNLKWLKPVYPNDTLSVKVTVKNKRLSKSKPDRGIVTTYCEIINQNNMTIMSLTTNGFVPVKNKN